MISGFRVIAPGLFTTVQDLGRRGFQNIGVPVSGALDRIALTSANVLAGNAGNAAALEMLVQGPTLEVEAESVRIAAVGVDSFTVEGRSSRTIGGGRSVRVMRGETVRFAALPSFCGYLAIEGGVAVPPVLGSAATYVRNRVGGLDGRTLMAGDIVPVAIEDVADGTDLALSADLDPGFDRPIRVVLGPQDDYFTEDAVATFLSGPYRISRQADRMGFRFEGPALTHAKGSNIVSDGIVAGSVQVPGSGQPIVLLADAQTAGGYPKIATVISADIPLLVRRGPGREVRFAAVTQADAEAIRREQEAALAADLAAIAPFEEAPRVSAEALYETNLVDGVASATD
jgi:allophanate hydrolase